jgi:CDP-diacylglycerol--serine O-phosphatidyltransferase
MGTQVVVRGISTRSHTWLWRIAADACTLSVFGLGWLAIAYSGQPPVFLGILILAGLLDGLDGILARRGSGPSLHGAVLDVIADATTFGLAPLVFSQLQGRLPGTLLEIGIVVYLTAVIGRLVRSAQKYYKKTTHFTGLPMPSTGILLAGLTLVLPATGYFPALVSLSALAVSRLSYPRLTWLWQNEHRWFTLVFLGSAGLAIFNFPEGLVAALLSYTAYPGLVRCRVHFTHPEAPF